MKYEFMLLILSVSIYIWRVHVIKDKIMLRMKVEQKCDMYGSWQLRARPFSMFKGSRYQPLKTSNTSIRLCRIDGGS